MSIRINIDKAKEIKRDQFRTLRKPLLESLDVAFVRALEQGDAAAQASIAAEKQALRDVTKVPLPDDVEALKAFIPEILS